MTYLLFPGSFSPFTDGHYWLVKKYLNDAKIQNIKVDKIIIIMSSKDREGIKTNDVFDFVTKLYSNDKRFDIRICKGKSPIGDCYDIVLDSKPGNKFIFAGSTKDGDKRNELFVKYFSKGSRNYKEGVEVLSFDISMKPLLYTNRNDRFNNTPVSASVARNDIRNNNFENFLTNYQTILKETITINKRILKRFFDIYYKTIDKEMSKDSNKKLLKVNGGRS